MRIDKLLSNMGLGSRSEIKKHAKNGLIKINGQTHHNPAQIIDTEKDLVYFDDQLVEYKEFIYLMLNKPQGVVSATMDNFEDTVIDIMPEEFQSFKPFPVGRLDKDTEGLLILTNDGKLSHDLLSPKHHVDKKYFAIVQGPIGPKDILSFTKGLKLEDGYVTLPATLNVLKYDDLTNQSQCEVTIQEGKYHQVKRMFFAISSSVLYLKRIQMGSLKLDENLELGEFRILTDGEVELLKTKDV